LVLGSITRKRKYECQQTFFDIDVYAKAKYTLVSDLFSEPQKVFTNCSDKPIMTENYKQEELTIDMGRANLVALFYFIFFFIVFGVPFFMLSLKTMTTETCRTQALRFGDYKLLKALFVILIGIIAHELIHGITWARFAEKGFKSISFGVAWRYMSPYCHCNEPLLVKHYLLGAIMPGIILGIVPLLLALFTGNILLFLFGITFSVAATGDFMMVNMLRKESMTSLVQDHPEKVGCYIYRHL